MTAPAACYFRLLLFNCCFVALYECFGPFCNMASLCCTSVSTRQGLQPANSRRQIPDGKSGILAPDDDYARSEAEHRCYHAKISPHYVLSPRSCGGYPWQTDRLGSFRTPATATFQAAAPGLPPC